MPHYHVTVEEIDQLLPQTQCGECGYSGCLPYAKAMVNHHEAINKCPPGGVTTLVQLAEKLGQSPEPFIAEMENKTRNPQLAFIREAECIGCTKCIQACPVDAVIGTAKMMHTIIADECTGCELCIPACPVDCIDLIPIDHYRYDPKRARQRYLAKLKRQQEHADKQLLSTQRQLHLDVTDTNDPSKDIKQQSKKDLIKSALMRVNEKKKDCF